MIKNKTLSLVVLFLFFFWGAKAQENSSLPSADPQKGTIMLGISFGVGPYINQAAPLPNQANYSLSAPMSNWFDSKPILNVEGKYFLNSEWALKLSGGFTYNFNPGRVEQEGTVKENQSVVNDVSDIPNYNTIPKSDNIQFAIGLGIDRYKKLAKDLYFRYGFELGFAYGRASVNANSEEYVGRAIGEAYSFRPALVTGFDYFIGRSIYTSIEVRPVAYQYAVYGIRPRVGLGLWAADSHSFLFLAQPMIKFGIRF